MFEKKWEAQCDAAKGIAERFGIAAALEYLIGEKLLAHLDAAATNVKFRRELPQFVARIRETFDADDLAAYFNTMERAAAPATTGGEGHETEERAVHLDPSDFAKRLTRLAPVKDLLLCERLGSG